MAVERRVVAEYIVDESIDGRKDVYHVALEDGGLYTVHHRDDETSLMGINLDSDNQTGCRLFSLETTLQNEKPLYVACLATTAFNEFELENPRRPVKIATSPQNETVDKLVKEVLGLFIEDEKDPSALLVQDSRIASGMARAALRRYNAYKSLYLPSYRY